MKFTAIVFHIPMRESHNTNTNTYLNQMVQAMDLGIAYSTGQPTLIRNETTAEPMGSAVCLSD